MARMRGARPTPRHHLLAATPHRIVGTTPAQHLVVPSKLSAWLNFDVGDCVTAEEAFNKACSGIFISDTTVRTWATKNGVLNGAYLNQVMEQMQTKGFEQDGNTYDGGAYYGVDWTNATVLNNAIAQGPVKIGVVAGQLDGLYGNLFGLFTSPTNGWLATGFTATKQADEDHCVSLCGYGTISWLLAQLGGTLPPGVDGTMPGYALFTWSAIGVVDMPSLLHITWEAWLRSPNSVTVGKGKPTPDPVVTF